MRTHVLGPRGDLASTAPTPRKVALTALILMACHACSTAAVGDGKEPDERGAAAAPVISPGSSASNASITATVSCPSTGSFSHLTTDGSTPTTSSPQSSTATFTSSGTLSAICAGAGYAASPVASATYTINRVPTAAPPTITPGTSASTSAITATVTCSSAGTVPYLTTDGSTPTTSSTQRASATFTTSGTLKAICAGGAFSPSSVTSATYTIVASATVTHGFAIPVAHPRIWFTPERIAAARTWWASHSFRPLSFADVAFAHVASGGAVSCRADVFGDGSAIDYALSNPVSKGQDAMRYYGEDVILIYDWCHDELQAPELAETKAKIEADTRTWMTEYMNASWGGPRMYHNNYHWGTLRNQVEWAIATYYEYTADAETYLDDALDERWTDHFLAEMPTVSVGGVFQEGSEYGRYLPYYAAIPFTTVQLGGRDIWAESTFFKSAVLHTIYSTLPAKTTSTLLGTDAFEAFPFADTQFWRYGASALTRVWRDEPGSYTGDWMQLMAYHWSDIDIGKYAQQWVNMLGMGPIVSRWVQAASAPVTPLAFDGLPLDYYAPGMGFFYARKAWDTSSTVVHLQLRAAGGGAADHNHMDYGNWQMWRGGRWMTRESGDWGTFDGSEMIAAYGGSGTLDAQFGVGHNVILINPDSRGCTVGTTCAKGGSGVWGAALEGRPTVTRMESRPGYAFAVTDLTPAYRTDDGRFDNPAAKNVVREFIFVRDLEALVVFDRLEANPLGSVPASSIKKVFLAHCEAPWTMEDGQHSRCTNGPQAMRVTTLVPATTTRQGLDEGNHSGRVGQYRLEVTDSGSAQSYFLHVVQAKGTGDADLSPAVVDNGSSYTVTLDATHSLTLDKGMRSSGGSIIIGGTTTSLAAGVQPISFEDSGPVWGP